MSLVSILTCTTEKLVVDALHDYGQTYLVEYEGKWTWHGVAEFQQSSVFTFCNDICVFTKDAFHYCNGHTVLHSIVNRERFRLIHRLRFKSESEITCKLAFLRTALSRIVDSSL